MNEMLGLNLIEVNTVISHEKIIECAEKDDHAEQMPSVFSRNNIE